VWLTDRTLVGDLIGDYASLPDLYSLGDYERETAGVDVRGIVWSDAGGADPVAAAEWVGRQHEERGLVTGIVSLGDPAADGFGESTLLDQPVVMEHFNLMARHGLVATIEPQRRAGRGDAADP
jgi:predicted TIM-barrel fold metal-dependent hydrolase